MREVVRYFFRADTKTPHFNDRTNRHASFADHGFSARIRHRLRYKSGDQHFPIESSPFIGLVYHGHHRHSIFSYVRIRQAKGAFYVTGGFLAIGVFCSSAFEFFDKLGGINRLSPFIAAWFPNLIFGFGGVWMLLRVKT